MKTLSNIEFKGDFRDKEECILENAKGFIAVLCLAKYHAIELPSQLIRVLSPRCKLSSIEGIVNRKK